MQLKTIKVAGFKSFADSTLIPLQSSLTGIVGPNGCGKSNVVDAIRCVLSGVAKQLRGETLPDVIFNGSLNRKPVGQASVEMVFDNGDGSLGGAYAQYPEICVRREINRDATSSYFLNGARCRRRDIVDIFLGTGLGPQSYAIIEQGMISKLIEAKPEELRVYLEEAAGTSKYKERRRETENRIQQTRENLQRLADHRIELEKQLAHLKRQANAAEKYKALKQEERLLKAQLQALLWRELGQQIHSQNSEMTEKETQLEKVIAQQRQLDAEIEKWRSEKIEFSDAFNAVQNNYYGLGSEIARLEQDVKHMHERSRELQTDIAQLEENNRELKEGQQQDQFHADEMQADLLQLEPKIVMARKQAEQSEVELQSSEQAMQDWQTRWDEFNQYAAKTARELEVEKTRIQHLSQVIDQNKLRQARVQEERSQFDFQLLDSQIREWQQQEISTKQQLEIVKVSLADTQQQVRQERSLHQQLVIELDQIRNRLQNMRGRLASLEALQQAALGKTDQGVSQWLQQQRLEAQPRLAENMQVTAGWELAVETVLRPYLEAVCIDDFATVSGALNHFDQGYLSLFKTKAAEATDNIPKTTLASKVDSQWSLNELLAGIYTADSMADALPLIASLNPHESIITRDGIWLGKTWVRISKKTDNKSGVLQRERELKAIQETLLQEEANLKNKEHVFDQTKLNLTQLEAQQEQLRQQLSQLTTKQSEIYSQLSIKQAKVEQLKRREQALEQELQEAEQQIAGAHQQLISAQTVYAAAQTKVNQDAAQRQSLSERRDQCREQLEFTRQQAKAKKNEADELAVQLETTRNQLHYARQSIQKAEKQVLDLQKRRDTLQNALTEIENPLQMLNQQLTQALENRLAIERELDASRQRLNQTEYALQQKQQQRESVDKNKQGIREELESMRMKLQALTIHQSTHQEKIIEANLLLDDLLAQLPDMVVRNEWEEKIIQIENRIQRLGAINLAAIDEHTQLSERKTYLDAQNDDLMQALHTLEEAIRKIDHESRARLQDTFDQVNLQFNTLFQQIFNGGQAGIELTEGDVLASGMIVKAQPPGKRNTTIHLLSGGEKALTAIALVFAIFQLNPAPFCILDEVDAPLDDVNVGRFCHLLKEMSKKIQFIFISHNKLTIEMAEQLIGVTMNEPGVSRLVSVDIDQAVAMATT